MTHRFPAVLRTPSPEPEHRPGANRLERPLWFGPDDRPLFGWLGAPTSGRPRGAVLLCAPIGADARAGARVTRALSERLAAAGFATLRFDYDGIGDSVGSWTDPDRVDAWTESIRQAALLLGRYGAQQVSAIGIGSGATLLAHALPLLTLHSCALWAPVLDGRGVVREQQLLMTQFPVVHHQEEGAVEVPGFSFSAELLADVGRMDVVESLRSSALPPRALVAWPEGRPLGRGLRRLRSETEMIEFAEVESRAPLFEVSPTDAVLPHRTLGRLVDWFSAEQPSPFAPEPGIGSTETVFRTDSGVMVRERAVQFGTANLFAILTDPVDGPEVPPDAPRLVMTGVAGETHVGPARVWVDWAREWAADGVRSCRVDMSGFGDSGTWPDQREFTIYAPQWFDDLDEILQLASPEDPSNAVLMGLCSGAYICVESALGKRPPRGIVAINPWLRVDGHDYELADDRRRRAWRRDPRFLEPLARRNVRAARLTARAIRELLPVRSQLHPLSRTVRGGSNVLVLHGETDMRAYGYEPFWRAIGLPLLRRTGRFRFVVHPLVDHALHRRISREAAHDVIRNHLLSTFYGATATPDAGRTTAESSPRGAASLRRRSPDRTTTP